LRLSRRILEPRYSQVGTESDAELSSITGTYNVMNYFDLDFPLFSITSVPVVTNAFVK